MNSNSNSTRLILGCLIIAGCSSSKASDTSSTDAGKGCGDTTLLSVPKDPGVRGPWKVGVRTVKIGRLTTEIVYPAEPGSEAGKPEQTYDVRDWLPPSEKSKVPDDASPAVEPIGGDLYRDLPLDGAHGPYPVVVFIHGTSSFRIASGSTLVHWASRGFVVLGADYPGLFLTDQLCHTSTFSGSANPGKSPYCTCQESGEQDVPGDVKTQLEALANPAGDLAFLAGHVDTSRVAISGHSQGACIAAGLSTLPNVQVIIPMTGSLQVLPSPSLKSVMFIAGMEDSVIGYDTAKIGNAVCEPVTGQDPSVSNKTAFEKSAGPPGVVKRLVGISGGGHLVPTDLCQNNAFGRNAITEAEKDGVCGIDEAAIAGLPRIFDCGTIDMPTGIEDVNYASTAALEETLLCKDRTSAFANLKSANPTVGEFVESK